MKPSADLVVMDWGIGGLSVYSEIRKVLPRLSILYYSDSGATPYGKMSSKELETRIYDLIQKFSKSGYKHFVVACNAASTVLPKLERKFRHQGLQVAGVIDCGIELIHESGCKNIGVIGGRRTILSKCYTKSFRKQKSLSVIGRVAQPLSALIEAGELDTPRMQKTLQTILAPLKSRDAVVLACTHYPAVLKQIQQILPQTILLDPAKATARFVKQKWKWSKKHRGRSVQIFMSSGDPHKMKVAAARAFQIKIAKVVSSPL